MSFDLSAQSRKLAVSDVSVTVSLLICHVYLNVQLLRMSEILALIERKAVIFRHGVAKLIICKLYRSLEYSMFRPPFAASCGG